MSLITLYTANKQMELKMKLLQVKVKHRKQVTIKDVEYLEQISAKYENNLKELEQERVVLQSKHLLSSENAERIDIAIKQFKQRKAEIAELRKIVERENAEKDMHNNLHNA